MSDSAAGTVSERTRGQWALRLGTLALSFIGYLDSLYLTIAHYRRVVPPCSVIRGCESVLTGRFSSFFGVPTALLGVVFYVVTFYLTVLTITSQSHRYALVLKLAACAGLLVSAFLFLTEALVLKAYCQYCIVSAVASLGVFVCSLGIRGETGLRRHRGLDVRNAAQSHDRIPSDGSGP
jgi:uncharacterized membrane protein